MTTETTRLIEALSWARGDDCLDLIQQMVDRALEDSHEALRGLLTLGTHPDEELRAHLHQALAERSHHVMPHLLQVVAREQDLLVRLEAGEHLQSMGWSVLTSLRELCGRGRWPLEAGAFIADPPLADLEAILLEGPDELRHPVAWTLGTLGYGGLSALARGLGSQEVEARLAAAYGLAMVEPDLVEARQHLRQAREDASAEVRRIADLAHARLAHPLTRVARPILRILARPEPELRLAARELLQHHDHLRQLTPRAMTRLARREQGPLQDGLLHASIWPWTTRAELEATGVLLEATDPEVRLATVQFLGALRREDLQDDLVLALEDEDGGVRAAAAEALGADPAAAAWQSRWLLPLLEDRDPRARTAALRSLIPADPEGSILTSSQLHQALVDQPPDVRVLATNQLQRLERGHEARQVLMEQLHTGDVATRRVVLRLLGELEPMTDEAREALRKGLQDPEPLVRTEAAMMLALDGDGSPAVMQELTAGLRSPSLLQRAGCCRSLENLGQPAGSVIVEAAGDPSLSTRRAVAEILPPLAPLVEGGRRALEGLLRDPEPQVRAATLYRLSRLPWAERDRYGLREALQDPDTSVRFTAAVTLLGEESNPDGEVLAGLVAGLQSPARSERLQAARQLTRVGDPSEIPVPALLEALGDPASLVRESALSPLGRTSLLRSLSLAEHLQHANGWVRQGILALQEVLPPREEDLAALEAPLDDPCAEIRECAGLAVGNILRTLHEQGRSATDAEGQEVRARLHEGLQRLAQDGVDQVRQAAWYALQLLGSWCQVPPEALARGQADEDELVRILALLAEARRQEDESAGEPAVGLRALEDPGVRVRRLGCRLASELGLGAVLIRQRLVPALEDADPWVRLLAARQLAEGGGDTAPITRLILETLHGSEPACTAYALALLEHLGDRARDRVPELRRLLEHPRPALRGAALRGLLQLEQKDRATVKALCTQLPRAPASMQEDVMAALVQLATQDESSARTVVRAFEEGLRASTAPERLAAMEALHRLGARGTRALGTLERLLHRESLSEALAAAGTILKLVPEHEEALTTLLRGLRSSHPVSRTRALVLLRAVRVRGEAVVEALLPLLRDSVPFLRVGAMAILEESPDLLATRSAELLELAREPLQVDDLRLALVSILAQVDPTPEGLTDLLAGMLQEENPGLRRTALLTLARMGEAGREALPAVLACQRDDPVPAIQATALLCLGHIHPESGELTALLEEALASQHLVLRARAAQLLGKRGAQVEVLLPVIEEALTGEEDVVASAAAAIRHLGAAAAPLLPQLRQALEEATSEDLLELLLGAIHAMGPQAREATPEVTWLLRAGPEGIRLAAAATLGQIRASSPAAVEALLACLMDHSEEMRQNAAFALGTVTPVTDQVLEGLTRTLGDPAGEVCKAAALALGRIGPLAQAAVPVLDQMARATPNRDLQMALTYARQQIIGSGPRR